MKIDRNKVHLSMWVPIVAVALILFILGLAETLIGWRGVDFFDLIAAVGLVMFIGAVVWLPAALICLIVERVGINENTTRSHLKQMLFLETLIPFLIFNAITSQGNMNVILGTLVIALVAQLTRWFYLSRKNRMFEKLEGDQK